MDSLAKIMEQDMGLWSYWGFEPWNLDSMSGVKRKVAFVKPALLGEVARYYAVDTIVWNLPTEVARENLWSSMKPLEDVMTQRFLFLIDQEPPLHRIKSFLFGFKGYKEFHSYWPGRRCHKRLNDLAPLVDKAIELHKVVGENGGGVDRQIF